MLVRYHRGDSPGKVSDFFVTVIGFEGRINVYPSRPGRFREAFQAGATDDIFERQWGLTGGGELHALTWVEIEDHPS